MAGRTEDREGREEREEEREREREIREEWGTAEILREKGTQGGVGEEDKRSRVRTGKPEILKSEGHKKKSTTKSVKWRDGEKGKAREGQMGREQL